MKEVEILIRAHAILEAKKKAYWIRNEAKMKANPWNHNRYQQDAKSLWLKADEIYDFIKDNEWIESKYLIGSIKETFKITAAHTAYKNIISYCQTSDPRNDINWLNWRDYEITK